MMMMMMMHSGGGYADDDDDDAGYWFRDNGGGGRRRRLTNSSSSSSLIMIASTMFFLISMMIVIEHIASAFSPRTPPPPLRINNNNNNNRGRLLLVHHQKRDGATISSRRRSNSRRFIPSSMLIHSSSSSEDENKNVLLLVNGEEEDEEEKERAILRQNSNAPPPTTTTTTDMLNGESSASTTTTTTTTSTTSPVNGDVNGASVGFGVGNASQRLGDSATKPTVWTEFGRLASIKEKQLLQQQDDDDDKRDGDNNDVSSSSTMLVNLGQGFPNWTPPKFCIDSLVSASLDITQKPSSPHQYTRPAGHPPLVKQLANRYSKHLQPRIIDPYNEIAITVGASQALYLSLQSHISVGDEVVLFEPFFDLYVNQIKLAGGKPVYVPLDFVPYTDNVVDSGGTWMLDENKFQYAITDKTKAIILNSPHNPTGKIFTRKEMMMIANALQTKTDPSCIVLSDEVYKYIVHAPPPPPSEHDDEKKDDSDGSLHCRGHVHFASLDGMWNRTITISSAGKTFSATGWQVGWCIGPIQLIQPIQSLLPYIQFCPSTIIQDALARSLPIADQPYMGYESYYDYLRTSYKQKRDILARTLQDVGFIVPNYDYTPGGGFFLFVKIGSKLLQRIPEDKLHNTPNIAAPNGIARRDWMLCEYLLEEYGILCIPSSPFFSIETIQNKGTSDHYIRVAFCKTDITINEARQRLQTMMEESSSSSSSSSSTMTYQ